MEFKTKHFSKFFCYYILRMFLGLLYIAFPGLQLSFSPEKIQSIAPDKSPSSPLVRLPVRMEVSKKNIGGILAGTGPIMVDVIPSGYNLKRCEIVCGGVMIQRLPPTSYPLMTCEGKCRQGLATCRIVRCRLDRASPGRAWAGAV